MLKKCNKCEKMKNLFEFHKDNTKKDKLHTQCIECNKLIKFSKKVEVKEVILFKTCIKCNNNLSILNFSKLKYNKDGFDNNCKECCKKYRIKKNNIIIPSFNKTCIVCKISKHSSTFKTTLRSKDNIFNTCIECWPKPKWNKEKQSQSSKKYWSNNPKKLKLKYQNQAKNTNRRIRDSLNHRISGALKTSNLSKNNMTHEYIGCSIAFLKEWLKFQFQENMSFDNYGEWHLDHVKPCSLFDFNKKTDITECFHWTNLQPLWSIDNIKKGNTYDITLLQKQKDKINKFSAQVKEGELRE